MTDYQMYFVIAHMYLAASFKSRGVCLGFSIGWFIGALIKKGVFN